MTANINEKTGIAYGVIRGDNVPGLMENIIDNGTDESFESMKAQLVADITKAFKEAGVSQPEATANDIVDDLDFGNYECDEPEYTYKDGNGNTYILSYLGGAPLIWCVETSRIVQVKARWVNTRGEKGPWSEITTATVAA